MAWSEYEIGFSYVSNHTTNAALWEVAEPPNMICFFKHNIQKGGAKGFRRPQSGQGERFGSV